MRVQTALIAVTCAATVLVACGGNSLEGELRNRLEGFFEATLNGDVTALDDFVSESCSKKAEFLALIGAAPVFEDADIKVPKGAFSFDLDDGVAVAKRIQDSQPLLVNGDLFEDDPSNDIPLKLVEEVGVWRIENCGAYISE